MTQLVNLKNQIAKAEAELQSLEKQMRKEPQFDRQLGINKQVKTKRTKLEELKQEMEKLK